MNDHKRELIVRVSAYGFVVCILILLLLSIAMGKNYGRNFLLTTIPLYSIFYAVIYNYICRGFESETKRISAFGIIARGTFVGAIYYTSIFISLIVVFLFIIVSFNAK